MSQTKEKTVFQICMDEILKDWKKCQQCGKESQPLQIYRGKRLCPWCYYILRDSFWLNYFCHNLEFDVDLWKKVKYQNIGDCLTKQNKLRWEK